MRSRPLPLRKTLGTGWNLRPDTERADTQSLRVGDVVMESFDHPFLITRLNFRNGVIVYGKYVWQGVNEKSWMLDRSPSSHISDRARRGEY